jgi:phage/plasmid-associated DNA primase
MANNTTPGGVRKLLESTIPRAYWPGLLRLVAKDKMPIDLEGQKTSPDGLTHQVRAAQAYAADAAGKWNYKAKLDEIVDHYLAGGNIGIDPPPSIIIIDCDNVAACKVVKGLAPKGTPTMLRKPGKMHFYFRDIPGAEIPFLSKRYKLAEPNTGADIDARTPGNLAGEKGGNLAVVAPSMHQDGKPYKWEVPLPALPAAIPEMPAALRTLLMALEEARSQTRSPRQPASSIPRHDRLRSYIMRAVRYESVADPEASMRRVQINAKRYAEELFEGDKERCASEVEDLARSIEGAWSKAGGEASRDDQGLDTTLAHLISSAYGHPWRYVEKRKFWYEWNNVYWEQKSHIAIEQIIQRFADTLLDDAIREHDQARREKLMKLVVMLGRSSKVTSVAKAMMREFQADALDFDANLDLVTFPDSEALGIGAQTYNVRTGEVRDPSPMDYITLVLGAPYMPGHTHPAVDAYWATSFPKEETRDCVQMHLSLGLIAWIPQERIYSMYGSQSSGKGTLLYGTAAALGGYATGGNCSTLRGDGGFDGTSKDFDLIDFRGRRFLYFDEFGGGVLGEKAKTLSQEGTIRGEAKYQDSIEFPITWSLWLATNTRPRIDYTDKGICRRVIEIPMNNGSKTPNDPDPATKQALLHDESAIAANLAVLVAALGRAREHNFCPPISKEMREATQDWKFSSDLIAAWHDTHVEDMGEDHRYKIEGAYSKYLSDMTDMFPGASRREVPRANKHQFASAMRERGYDLRANRYYGCRYHKDSELDEDGKLPNEPKLP